MRKVLNFAVAGLLIGGPALYAQQSQQQPTQQQDQSVYQQNQQDQQNVQNPDQNPSRNQDQDWNRNQQVHRDRDQNWNNNQADQDRDRVNEYHQYNNGQNGTYTDQQRDRERTYNNGQYNNGQYSRSDRNRQYGTDRDRDRDRDQSGDHERTYSRPQNDEYGAEMSPAQRSGWRDGIAAGRADHEAGRNFSPRPSGSQFEGSGQDRQLYRQAFQQGYRRGYYGNNGNDAQYPR